MTGSEPGRDRERNQQERELALGREAVSLAVSALFTLPLLADTAAHWLGWRAFFLADAKIQLALVTVVHLWGGARFYADAIKAPHRGRPRTQALVALATGAAFLYGAYAAFAHPDYAAVPFKLSAAGVTLTILARLLRTV